MQSNKSAIGAKISAKASINSTNVWQRRDVSAQNSFNGANMLNVHMGFGNATTIDSLVVQWNQGLRQVFTNVSLNRFYSLVEGGSLTPTAVVQRQDAIPNAFSLEQNYPNPFNPTTTIQYTLPSQQFMTLRVFDILGREVQTLAEGYEERGLHSVEFTPADFTSGVYFYRLTAGNFTASRRMLLLKVRGSATSLVLCGICSQRSCG